MENNRIEQILTDYIRHNLSPTRQERDNVSENYQELQSILEGRAFQNGSYARSTSMTPVNDLDVFYVLPESIYKTITEVTIDPDKLDISNILEDLAKALRRAYSDNANIKVQPHSVGIYFGTKEDFSIDVVPAIPANDDMYWVPETAHLSVQKRRQIYESFPHLTWIKSDPKGYIQQAKKLDEKSMGRFRKAVKFVKKWKAGCKKIDKNFPLKSFHLELIVTELFKENPMITCFTSLDCFFEQLDQNIVKPKLPDRADSLRYIDGYLSELTEADKESVYRCQQEAHEILQEILSSQTEAEVLKGIERLLKLDSTTEHLNLQVIGTSSVSQAYSKPYHSE